LLPQYGNRLDGDDHPFVKTTPPRQRQLTGGLAQTPHPRERSKDARKKGRLFVIPMENVRRFTVPKREMRHLTMEQVKALCEHVGRV
jgi:hypothetical protein